VSYDSNLQHVREVLLKILTADERIHSDPEPVVWLNNFGDSSLNLVVRAWTSTENVWPVYFETMEKIKSAFDQHDIEIPFPQRVIHTRNSDI
jgi:small conductance mechanosensitive channel